VGTRLGDGRGRDRIEGGSQTLPDRIRAGGRKLLPTDDRDDPREARLAAAQPRHASYRYNRRETLIQRNEMREPLLQIGLGIETEDHIAKLSRPSLYFNNAAAIFASARAPK